MSALAVAQAVLGIVVGHGERIYYTKEILPTSGNVAVSADWMALGTSGGYYNEGALRIFNRRGGTWVEIQLVLGTHYIGRLGSALAFDGDSLLVSAPWASVRGLDHDYSGIVFDYQLDGDVWVKQSQQDGSYYAFYGSIIKVSETTLAISAPSEGNEFPIGAVHVSTRASVGEPWVSEGKLPLTYRSDGEITPAQFLGTQFGTALDVAGERIIVGAQSEDSADPGVGAAGTGYGAPNSGAAYIYERQAGEWVEIAFIKASDVAQDRNFGIDAAISGDHAAVADIGSVHTFHFEAGQWVQNGAISDPVGFAQASSRLEMDGDTLLIGPRIYQFDSATGEWGHCQTVPGVGDPQLIMGDEIYYSDRVLTRAEPRRLYVNHAAAAGGDGSSWPNALRSLQDAIAIARSNPGDLDEIWLAGGVYFPDDGVNQVQGDESATFSLPEGVAIRGGFQGNESDFSDRQPGAFPTVLSGDIDHNDADADSDGVIAIANDIIGDNADHVVTVQGEWAKLDGVVITGGQADGEGGVDTTRGGGAWVENGGLALLDCILRGNTASADGGGLFSQGADLNLTGCELLANRAGDDGGAIYTWDSACQISRCRLSGNLAVDRAGGLYLTGVRGHLASSLLSGNVALNAGGGLYSKRASDFWIQQCTIAANYAATGGGGVFMEPGSGGEVTEIIELENSALWGNATAQGTEDPSAGANTGDVGVAFRLQFGARNLIQDPALDQLPPEFLEPVTASPIPHSGGDYHFSFSSPLIKYGPSRIRYSQLDLDGEARGGILGAYGTIRCDEYFLDVVHPGLPPEGDANGNGLSNLLEFETGGDPTQPNWESALRVVAEPEMDRLRLEYFSPDNQQRRVFSGRAQQPVLEIEVATSPAGPWQRIEDALPAGSISRLTTGGGARPPELSRCVEKKLVYVDESVGNRLFFRLRVILAP